MIYIVDKYSFKKAFVSHEECMLGHFTFNAVLLRNLGFNNYEECVAWFDMKEREIQKEKRIKEIRAAADDYA